MRRNKNHKEVDYIIHKRDIGIKMYGVESEFLQEYMELWASTCNISNEITKNLMNNFFDKWNIETRHKKLNQIINKITNHEHTTK